TGRGLPGGQCAAAELDLRVAPPSGESAPPWRSTIATATRYRPSAACERPLPPPALVRFLGRVVSRRLVARRVGVGFNADEAHNIIKECIDGVLGGEDYNQNNINQWTASIVEQSLAHLVKLGKAYKYIVTCAVVQRSAYGFHTASSCFWDTTSDGTCTVRWENRTMNCIVNVFAIAIVL
uniref:Dynein light chain Tctex-type 3 n=1 Tax=Equus caballus TaxID=9796 RepID=F6RHT2_HORSE